MAHTTLSIRYRAIIIGISILVAYGVLVSSFTQLKSVVMLADVISGLAVICIAVLMLPLFKLIDKGLTVSYLSLKILEGGLMIAGGLLFLSSSYQYLRDWIYEGIHLYTFIVSGFLFYYLLYQSKLVPRFIAMWGLIAVFSMLVTTILRLLNLSNPVLDALLILMITNEVFLAFWLIFKGFNTDAREPVRGKVLN